MRAIVTTVIAANVLNGVLAWALVFGELGARSSAWSVRAWPPRSCVGSWSGSARDGVEGSRAAAAAARRVAPVGADPRMIGLGPPIGVQYQLEFGVFARWRSSWDASASWRRARTRSRSTSPRSPSWCRSASRRRPSVLVGHGVGAGDAGARGARSGRARRGRRVHGGERAGAEPVPRLLARVYTPDATVIALAATLIPIAGVFQVFDGLQVVSIGVLRGIGDTRTPLIVYAHRLLARSALPVSLWLGFRAGRDRRACGGGSWPGSRWWPLLLLLRVRRQLA